MKCLKILTVLLTILFLSQNTFAQYKKGVGDLPQDYTSIAQVSGTADGTSVSFKNSGGDDFNNFAGTFNGILNGNAVKFYCIDLYHPLATNQDYWDESQTQSEITHILNNYFPFANHPNALSDVNKEAASVQLAIWSFSDDAVISSITNSTIKDRAAAIVADANANNANVKPIKTLAIVPDEDVWMKNSSATFFVKVLDIDGNPVQGIDVDLSTSGGSLDQSTVTTNANGEAGPISLSYFNYIGSVTISAIADVVIPQGTRYIHKATGLDKQQLVLATPEVDTKQTEEQIAFAEETTPQEKFLCFLKDGKTNHVGKLVYTTLPSGDINVMFYTNKSVNDNSYGVNSIGWGSKIHKFDNLVGSDKALFEFYDANGSLVMEFDLDYISSDNGGYRTLGLNGDGDLKTGQASWLLDYNTSLSKNLNELGYYLTVDSPPADNDYNLTLPTNYPNWIFDMVYEVTISKNAFGSAGFGDVLVPDMHNSPSKIDVKDLFECDPIECDGEIGDRVWLDFSTQGSAFNCNGIQDAGEPGIPNVTLILKDAAGNIVATTTTDQNGNYLFNINDLCNDLDNCFECNGKVTTLTLEYLGSVNNANIVVEQKNGEVVFNGTVQPGGQFSFTGTDKGTLGTEIKIFVNGTEQTRIHTSCSQPIGPGLIKGDFLVISGASLDGGDLCPIDGTSFLEKCYTVEVDESTLPAGYTATSVEVGTDASVDSNPNPSDVCLSTSDRINNTIDFGYCAVEECDNTIGNFVWHDQNTNGQQDSGEPGIEGVVVQLLSGSTVLNTTTTNASGYYEFTNVENGTYTVKIADVNFNAGEVLQNQNNASHIWFPTFKDKSGVADDKDSDGHLTDHTASVTLDCNDDDTIDFGFFKVCVELDKSGPASVQLGDQVTYHFEIHNCGDVLLSGGARLYDAMLGLDGTNNTGSYFQIQPGQTATLDKEYTPDADDCGELVNDAHVIGSPVLNGYNFGNKIVRDDDSHTLTVICKASIGDKVWKDLNENGIQDNNEPGVPGVTVKLYDCNNTFIAQKVTDQNGEYLFDNLTPGDYYVQFILPNGFSFTTKDAGSNDAVDSDADVTNGKTICTTLDPAETDITWDAGLVTKKASLGDRVWMDLNKNGIQDNGEPGVEGVTVKLYDCNDTFLAQMNTNNSGEYLFTNLAPGDYYVEFILPAGYEFSPKDQGTDDAKDSDADITTGKTVCTTLVAEETDLTWDAGIIQLKSAIGDKVWKDLNENGIQDNGEPGVQGVTVKLYDCNNTFIAQKVTDQNGEYLFDNLTPGDYYVQFVLPNGFSFTTKDAGSNDVIDSDADVTNGKTICTTLDPAETDLTWDAGLVVKKASLGDRVWMDLNKNGIQDDGEPGVQGVTVKLYDCNDTFLAQMNTNNLGEYLFTNLTPGDYYVEFILPAGYKFSPKDQGTDDAKDSDADITTGKTVCTTLVAEETDLTWDAGLIQLKSAIGDKVWNDLDKDGIQDGNEPGVPNVTVKLYDCNDNFIAQMNTNSNGEYLFDNLNPGDYYVQFTLPAGFGFSPKDQGSDDAKDSDADVTTGKTVCTTLAPEETDLTWDAGIFELKSAIGDKVWNDLDNDGIQDGNEPGVPNVTVKLYDCNNNIIGQTTTNSSGEYLFDNLTPGDYYVEFILPSGFVFSPQDQGGNNALDSDANESNGKTVCTNLAPGETDITWDAGVYEFACEGVIGDRVWLDFSVEGASENCNGIQDDGEPGIQGVKVILKDSQGNVIDFTFTDEHGNYLFEGLCTDDDCYKVYIDASTLPSGTVPTANDQGTDDTIDSDGSGAEVCLTDSHKEDLTIDFGFCTDGCGGCEEACVGDFVWFDANENGMQDNNESGVQDVIVKLYNESGTLIATSSTDADGYYRFDQLIPGRYYVKFDLPTGYVFTTKDAGSDDELDSDVGLSGRTATTLFVAGYCDLSWDAGLIPTPQAPSCLGDRVFFDKDNDGVQDINEAGVASVTVKLLSASDNSVIATTTTDYLGNYKFDNLTAGNYKIMFVLPAGYTFSPQDAGSDDELDSDAGNNGMTTTINLGTSECQLYWDAGIYRDVPDLRLNKEVDNSNPEIGDEITFTITVTNDGPGNATGVEVTDYFPTEGVSYNSYNASQGSFNSGSGVWSVGNLAAGQSATLQLSFTVEEYNTGNEFTEFDLGIASDYNVFALCSVNFPSSDSECKVAVGWDAYFQNYSVGDKLPSNSGDALVVGRNLTYVSGAVYNGNVVYGISTNLPQSNVSIDGDLIQDPNRIDFGAAGLYLKSLSAQLAGYAVNGTTNYQWGTLTLDGTDPMLNVFTVSGADLTSAHTTTINVPNGSVVVVNIDGNDITWTGGLTVNGTSINNVLYNFYEATFITIEGIDVRGSVLAPCATIDFKSGVINGQMIAKYIIGRGQFNCEPFLGNIPGRPNIINIAEVTHADQDDPDSTPNNGVPSEDDYAIATVYFENNGGSTGGTGDWQTLGEFGLTEVINSITADLNGNLLAGTAGGNLHISYNGGVDWTLLNASMTVGIIWDIAVGTNGYIYMATEQGIFVSMDGGTNWIGPMGGLIYGVNALEVDPSTGDIYAAVWGFGVYKSTNNGTSWAQVNAGLTNTVVNSLSISNQGVIFAGTYGGGVYVSLNGGTSWSTTNIQTTFVWDLEVTSNGYVYVATYGAGVYRSGDNGMSWEAVNAGLNGQYVYGIAVNSNDEIYVSTWTGGVFKLSTSLAKTPEGEEKLTSGVWEPIGMGGLGINTLMVDKNASTLYAGSNTGIIYKKNEGGITSTEEIVESPKEYKLNQNYPNPFNPSTAIEFGIKESGSYRLVVYNIIGQQVAELVNGDLSAGYHKVHFDASRLASGIYLYKLAGDKVNITRKMILMK